MAGTVLPITSTLIVKLPDYLEIPEYQEKIRAKKAIIRTVTQLLRSKELELFYVGYRPESGIDYELPGNTMGDCTIININIIEPAGKICDFNASQAMLLKRFKRELQFNHEHILIDSTKIKNGRAIRVIDIYIKSRDTAKAPVIAPNYTLSMGSLTYRV
jgi:hypothetical protein